MPIPFSPFQFRLQIAAFSLLFLAIPSGFLRAQKNQGPKPTQHTRRVTCLPTGNINVDTITSNASCFTVKVGDAVTFTSASGKSFSVDFEKSPAAPLTPGARPPRHFDERNGSNGYKAKTLDNPHAKKEDHKFTLVIDD